LFSFLPLAIARAISFGARVLILDEPTSSLTETEVFVLFDVMQRLKSEETSIVYVSHRFEELYAVCDRCWHSFPYVANAVFTLRFATVSNTLNMLLQVSTTMLVAVGMTFVIASRGIDLTVGSLWHWFQSLWHC
jgi:ABC-type dipeptide/oligopeptide/nickel transport system ATPase subunit